MDKPMKYEISLVRYYSPDSMIVDLFASSPAFLANETEGRQQTLKDLTSYWKAHELDPVDGGRVAIGEIVSLKMPYSWIIGMVANLEFKEGVQYYDVIDVITGCIINAHRMNIRELPTNFDVLHRYAIFSVVDILPIRKFRSVYEPWSSEACNGLRGVLSSASHMEIEVVAIKKTGFTNNYHRLYGNLYFKAANHIIDVKSWLLNRKFCFENRKLFEDIHDLTDENYTCCQVKDYLFGIPQKNTSARVEIPEITDDNLDQYLYPEWRRGGSAALPQKRRDILRKRLIIESHITFGQPSCEVVYDAGDKGAAASAISTEYIDEKTQDHLESGSSSRSKFDEYRSEAGGRMIGLGRAQILNHLRESGSSSRSKFDEYRSEAGGRMTGLGRAQILNHLREPASSSRSESDEYRSDAGGRMIGIGRAQILNSFLEPDPPRNPNSQGKVVSENSNWKPQLTTIEKSSTQGHATGAIRKSSNAYPRNKSYHDALPVQSSVYETELKAEEIRHIPGNPFAKQPSQNEIASGAIRRRPTVGHKEKLHSVDEDKTCKEEVCGNEVERELDSTIPRCESGKMEYKGRPTRKEIIPVPRLTPNPSFSSHHVHVVSEEAQKLLKELFK